MQQKARLCVQGVCGKRFYWHQAEVKRKLAGALVSVGAVAGFKVGKSACQYRGDNERSRESDDKIQLSGRSTCQMHSVDAAVGEKGETMGNGINGGVRRQH
jgi:hypothetical protein